MHIDYYFATISPWAFFGHDRLVAMARDAGATIAVKPVNLGEIFPVSGGLPLSKRAPQRQAYRLLELARWSDYLRLPITMHPKFFPANGDLAACWVLAAEERGSDAALAMTGAILRAIWTQERDIADAATLASLADELGLPAKELEARAAQMPGRFAAITQEAIDRGVFGSPTYIVDGEMFWGQDRLDFVARKLAK
jgi:carboxymethylenebutenolidase